MISDWALSGTIGAVLIVLGGLTIKGGLNWPKPQINIKLGPSLVSIYLFGVVYVLAAIGCVFPIFAGVILFSISIGNLIDSLIFSAIYVLGIILFFASINLLIAMYKSAFSNLISKHTPLLEKIEGIIFILAGIYLIFSPQI